MPKSMSYMGARPSLHSRWLSQDGNRSRLDWIIDDGETPKPKMVLVEVWGFLVNMMGTTTASFCCSELNSECRSSQLPYVSTIDHTSTRVSDCSLLHAMSSPLCRLLHSARIPKMMDDLPL